MLGMGLLIPMRDESGGSSLQPEVADYVSRVGVANISASTVSAINTFVITGKANGWWSQLLEVYPFCGLSLTASLVKLKYQAAAGSPSSLTNNGLLAANYSEAAGMGNVQGGTPPARFLQTGVSLSSLALGNTNLVMGGFMFNQNSNTSGCIIGDTSASGDSILSMYGTNFYPPTGAGAYTVSIGVGGFVWVCDTGKNFVYHTGVVQNRNLVPATFTSTTEIVIFKRNLASPQYYASGKVGMIFIGSGSGMTEAQASSLSRALYDFNLTVRTFTGPGTQQPPDLYFGDSLSSGYYSNPVSSGWAQQLSLARNRVCLDFGLPASATSFDITGVPSLTSRFTPAALNFPVSRVNFMTGTNDAQADSSTNGDPTKIAVYVASLTTLLQTAAAQWGASNIYVVSPPWRYGDKSLVFNGAWNAGMAAAAAAVPGVTFKDVYTAFIAQPLPSSLMQDNVHWNTAGHTFAGTTAA